MIVILYRLEEKYSIDQSIVLIKTSDELCIELVLLGSIVMSST